MIDKRKKEILQAVKTKIKEMFKNIFTKKSNIYIPDQLLTPEKP